MFLLIVVCLYIGSELTRTLISDELGLVDFHPSSNTAVVYASEADLVDDNHLRRKIIKLKKVTCSAVHSLSASLTPQIGPQQSEFIYLHH